MFQYAIRADRDKIEKDFETVDKKLRLISEERLRELLTKIGFTHI